MLKIQDLSFGIITKLMVLRANGEVLRIYDASFCDTYLLYSRISLRAASSAGAAHVYAPARRAHERKRSARGAARRHAMLHARGARTRFSSMRAQSSDQAC